jgi:hypothetical protein
MTMAHDVREGTAVTELERRCRRLLMAYPAVYRAERGDEIVGTLMEANSGRRRPPIRDQVALLVAGLKVRATENRRLSAGANFRLATLFGLLLAVSAMPVNYVSALLFLPQYTTAQWPYIVATAAASATIVAVWSGRRMLALIAASVAATGIILGGVFQDASQGQSILGQVPTALVLVAAGLVARRVERMPRAWFWLLGAFCLRYAVPFTATRQVPFLLTALSIGPLLAVFAWIVVDARPALGVAVLFVVETVIDGLTQQIQGGTTSPALATYFPLVLAAVMGVPALVRIRRQQTL